MWGSVIWADLYEINKKGYSLILLHRIFDFTFLDHVRKALSEGVSRGILSSGHFSGRRVSQRGGGANVWA